ncbi:MAG: helix-turn-helix transcriptional regulator, partial [Pseudomonadota bacterium]|nr:helix-turn-helix transcriptional regulator [Pseudomonadota bacterium]
AGDMAGAESEAARAFDLAAAKRHPWLLGELAFWRWQAARAQSTDPSAAGAPPAGAASASAASASAASASAPSASAASVSVSFVSPSSCAEPYRLQMNGEWQQAAAAWRALGCPYEEALALADGDEAARLAALALLEGLGARPLADQLRQSLRRAGARSIPRGAIAHTRGNEAGLTRRELEVLGLLAEGRRNSEIAARLSRSRRTVEHHVESILAKLGAASRSDAVDAARGRDLLPKKTE